MYRTNDTTARGAHLKIKHMISTPSQSVTDVDKVFVEFTDKWKKVSCL